MTDLIFEVSFLCKQLYISSESTNSWKHLLLLAFNTKLNSNPNVVLGELLSSVAKTRKWKMKMFLTRPYIWKCCIYYASFITHCEFKTVGMYNFKTLFFTAWAQKVWGPEQRLITLKCCHISVLLSPPLTATIFPCNIFAFPL